MCFGTYRSFHLERAHIGPAHVAAGHSARYLGTTQLHHLTLLHLHPHIYMLMFAIDPESTGIVGVLVFMQVQLLLQSRCSSRAAILAQLKASCSENALLEHLFAPLSVVRQRRMSRTDHMMNSAILYSLAYAFPRQMRRYSFAQ